MAYYTVPDNATTGNLTINITDSDFPLYLQVVPTLTAIYDTSGGYVGDGISITGSGFIGERDDRQLRRHIRLG